MPGHYDTDPDHDVAEPFTTATPPSSCSQGCTENISPLSRLESTQSLDEHPAKKPLQSQNTMQLSQTLSMHMDFDSCPGGPTAAPSFTADLLAAFSTKSRESTSHLSHPLYSEPPLGEGSCTDTTQTLKPSSVSTLSTTETVSRVYMAYLPGYKDPQVALISYTSKDLSSSNYSAASWTSQSSSSTSLLSSTPPATPRILPTSVLSSSDASRLPNNDGLSLPSANTSPGCPQPEQAPQHQPHYFPTRPRLIVPVPQPTSTCGSLWPLYAVPSDVPDRGPFDPDYAALWDRPFEEDSVTWACRPPYLLPGASVEHDTRRSIVRDNEHVLDRWKDTIRPGNGNESNVPARRSGEEAMVEIGEALARAVARFVLDRNGVHDL